MLAELLVKRRFEITRLPTIMKILKAQKERLFSLDNDVNKVFIENLKPQLEEKVTHGYGSDGFMMNVFLENVA